MQISQHPKNLIDSFLSQNLPIIKISWTFIRSFLAILLTDIQTNKPTLARRNISSLVGFCNSNEDNWVAGRLVNEAREGWGQGRGRGQKVWGRGRGQKFSVRPRPKHMRPRPRPSPQILMNHATYKYMLLSYCIIYHKTDINQTELT